MRRIVPIFVYSGMLVLSKITILFIYFTAVFLPLQSFDCTKKNSIASSITHIRYNTSGGRSGNYESLDISPDSLFYVQALRGNERSIKQKTREEFWYDLVSKVSLKDFDKIQSHPGHALYDGIDITITIETKRATHTIVNGNEDTTNYKKVQPFIDIVERKLESLRESITHQYDGNRNKRPASLR